MKKAFQNIYDAYCPMLYNIALQVSPTRKKAEEILLLSFKKAQRQKIAGSDKKPFCLDLIKLIIQTAKEKLHPGETTYEFKIREFENTPLLNRLLVEQLSIENYCVENGITRDNAMLTIRNEFELIRIPHPVTIYDHINSFHLN